MGEEDFYVKGWNFGTYLSAGHLSGLAYFAITVDPGKSLEHRPDKPLLVF
jgi:hypothetical protein